MKVTKMEILETIKNMYDFSSLVVAESFLLDLAYDKIKRTLKDLYDDMSDDDLKIVFTQEQIKNMVIAVTNELWAE